MTNQMWIIQM